MEMKTILRNGTLINEGKKFVADILIANGRIEKIASHISLLEKAEEINAEGLYVLPGCIDDQVHFREPGLTHTKAIFIQSLEPLLLVVLPALWKCQILFLMHSLKSY
jgi:dihydroorotase